MRRKLKLIDYCLILLGLTSLILGIKTMLEVQTLILPTWTLALIYGGVLLAISFGLGILASWLTKSRLHMLTVTSMIISIVCISFYINQFKPSYDIYVPDNFQGEVKLFRSTLKRNRLTLSEYGVGYITDKEYQNGFKPTVYKNGKDITNECKNIVQGSLGFAGVDGISVGPFSYIGFTIGDNKAGTVWNPLPDAIERDMLDTSLILK